MSDAVDALVAKIHARRATLPGIGGRERRSILLTGCGSHNGTSMTAIHLALALAEAGWETLLVDADLRKGEFKRHNDGEMGLSDYLSGVSSIDGSIRATNYPTLRYTPCGSHKQDPLLLLCSEKMSEFSIWAAKHHQYVVYDSPSITVAPDASVLRLLMDGVALIAALDVTTKIQLVQAKEEARKPPDNYYGVVVNLVDMNQYRGRFPQYNYFSRDELKKRHDKMVLRAARKAFGFRRGGKK
jgi:capsular exopolysaccharide synthesis family protein